MGSGHIELDRAVDSIRVGCRHRHDLGDLAELVASIRQLGLLQPITISPDGTLICGARRLAAVKELRWKQVNVWVRSGISTQLERLMAEQHENMRKPLTPTEAATLYRELKDLMAEDATRRQRASRFGSNAEEHPSSDGGATVAPPSSPNDRKTRSQAAKAITATKSYTTLERVSEVQRIADDPALPAHVRETAAAEMDAMNSDGNVAGHYRAVKVAALVAELEQLADSSDQPAAVRSHAARALRELRRGAATQPGEVLQLAQDALARAANRSRDDGHPPATSTEDTGPMRSRRPARQYGVRAFVLTWAELDGWTEHYDPAKIGPALTGEQWSRFEATVAATTVFADAARLARSRAPRLAART